MNEPTLYSGAWLSLAPGPKIGTVKQGNQNQVMASIRDVPQELGSILSDMRELTSQHRH